MTDYQLAGAYLLILAGIAAILWLRSKKPEGEK